jgi:uroporphyrin-III C-methyltransferase
VPPGDPAADRRDQGGGECLKRPHRTRHRLAGRRRPGDPDLLTRKAERLIRQASVIFHDALVGPGVLELVPPHVRLVSVGKRSGRHSKDQRTIDALIVEAALAGERVVRLKGGDPAIFGRATEELAACRRPVCRCMCAPGVTAASAAAASLGLSLTLRGLAPAADLGDRACAGGGRSSYSTGTRSPIRRRHWRSTWARPRRLPFRRRLIAAGLACDTPVVMVESASLPEERHFSTRLDLLPLARALRSATGRR